MRIIFGIFLLITFVSSNLLGQEKLLEIQFDYRPDNSVVFRYTKKIPGPVYLTVGLSQLQNAISPGISSIVTSDAGRLFELRPTQKDARISFQMTYQFLQGSTKKHNDEIVYAIPFSAGKTFIYSLQERNESDEGSSKGHRFITENRDTILATRLGKVIKIVSDQEDDFTDLDDAFIWNNSIRIKRNVVLVAHEDGSIATYVNFEKNSVFVKEEDEIEPGTPLGIIGQGRSTRLMVLFISTLDQDKLGRKFGVINRENAGKYNLYHLPKFYTADGPQTLIPSRKYVSAQDVSIVVQEMSKKEKKKRLKGQ